MWKIVKPTIAILMFESISLASQSFFYKEINLIAEYSKLDKWIGKSSGLKNSIGFEYFKKFSNKYGDYLTTDFQLRLACDSSEQFADAWSIEIHNAWGEYKLGYGSKLRFGHFDPAFGLEPILDTHGTLLQTQACRNIGFKKDWGIALKSYLLDYDYEIAAQIGSGMSIRRQDGSFLLTGRIGTSQGILFQYGISFLYGQVLQTEGMSTIPANKLISRAAVAKKRIGLDGQYSFGPYFFKGEFVFGENDTQKVLGYWLETDCTLPSNQNWQFEVQFQSWINDLGKSGSDDSTLILGTSYKISPKITLRMNYSHDFHLVNAEEDNKLILQLYYYGS